jgi:hypothetical protein
VNLYGYDGYQDEWVKERISLREYEGADSVYIKFQLATDGWIVNDGWYLSDIKIIGYPYNPSSALPKVQTFQLKNNYPNPFNPTTSIHFTILKATTVNLTIYNVLGQEVVQLISKKQYNVGNYKIEWNGANSHSQAVASGVYFYRLETKGASQTKKMLLIR